jgi:hypothetical protein
VIGVIFTLINGPWIGDPNLNARQRAELERITYERPDVIQLGKLNTTYCGKSMTTAGECLSDEIATFTTTESETEFTICFKQNESYNDILRADEDIRLVKLNGYFYIAGETINVGLGGKRGVKASTLIEITDCSSK